MADRELLVEIGCEEAPAEWLGPLARAWPDALAAELAAARLPVSAARGFATPRRLVAVAQAADRQEDRVEVVAGPPARIGRNEAGWTPAAIGFARKQGVAAEEMDDRLRIRSGPRGSYVVLERTEPGRPALDALPGVLGRALRRLRFPKPMQWDAELDGEPFPFGRPIRWIVALFGGEVVPLRIELAGRAPVVAGERSRGHRFRSRVGEPGAPFQVGSFAELRDGLRERFVLLDSDERVRRLAAEIERAEAALGAPRTDAIPLARLAGLVEWPGVVHGSYPEDFLDLPEAIRRTVLVEHQRYLPLDGAPAFLAVTNMPDDAEGRIRRGSERVTLARLRDAAFFWDEDRRTPLRDRAEDLANVVFHRRLGSFRDKAERIAALAGRLARGTPAEPEAAAEAARLAKCDLTTLLVGEFASLQGVAGGLLLREEGASETIWTAVRDHYRPGGLEGSLPETATGAVVALADAADTLVGLTFGGESASGAGDPFGLRRAAFSIIRILGDAPGRWGGRWRTPAEVLAEARAGYPDAGPDPALDAFFEERLRRALEREHPADAVRAVLGEHAADRRVDDLRRRVAALVEVRGTDDFSALAAAANRVRRILPDSMRTGAAAPDAALLVQPAERALLATLGEARAKVSRKFDEGRYADGLRELAALRGPVDRFFDEVLVMDENPMVRANRLRLLAALHADLSAVGDLGALERRRD